MGTRVAPKATPTGITITITIRTTTITGMSTATTTTTDVLSRGAFGDRFAWKWIVIGGCVAFTVYIGVIPLAFLLWQSFRTPQSAAADAVFTLANYTAAYGSRDTLSLFVTSIQFAS